MRKTIYVSLPALAAVLLAATPGRIDSPRNREPEEISRLDDCIQRRFLSMSMFGMRRVAKLENHGVRAFRPENAAEQTVVDQLEQKGYEVAFYLAGRGVLAASAAPAAEFPFKILDQRRFQIQGPAFITKGRHNFPQPDALLAEGRQALVSFQKGEGFDLQKGEWTVAMRPLRASNAACIRCHTVSGGNGGAQTGGSGLEIGDPLGVAIYVFAQND